MSIQRFDVSFRKPDFSAHSTRGRIASGRIAIANGCDHALSNLATLHQGSLAIRVPRPRCQQDAAAIQGN
jgi:hypothetical protein